MESPVCNSQHSTLREPERCWLCEPESSMVLIRSKRNLCALSSPMVTWITVSHPLPPTSFGFLTPPILLTRQSSLGCDSMEPEAGDWCGQLPFTAGETYLRPAACTAAVTCSATTSRIHFPMPVFGAYLSVIAKESYCQQRQLPLISQKVCCDSFTYIMASVRCETIIYTSWHIIILLPCIWTTTAKKISFNRDAKLNYTLNRMCCHCISISWNV